MSPIDSGDLCGSLKGFLEQDSPLVLRLRQGILTLERRFTHSVPGVNQRHPTRPDPNTGLGFICAQVDYDGTPPLAVKALVYPLMFFPAALNDIPHGSAVTGTPIPQTNSFQWSGTQEVPGAAHTPAGAPNMLAVWKQSSATGWVVDSAVPFLAVTGGRGPCGSGSGSSSGTGSGSGAGSSSFTGPRGRIYPAVWCVAASGFPGEHLGAFNATWALRQAAGTTTPTWDNGGDGKLAVRVTLTLDAKQGWVLTFALHALHATYTLPFQNNAFGPLRFAKKRAKVGALGTLSLPAVDLSAI